MLTHLTITNYALIEKLDIDFSTGYSVITGETGAGKSIILGALGLLMGQRADARAIKAGERKCIVEATFNVSRLALDAFFEANDIDFDGEECIVRRELTTTGKSRAFVNDVPVSLSILKALSASIIDIHSQHQNLLMGQENFLLSVLDDVASAEGKAAETADLPEKYAATHAEWRKACKTLEDLRRKQTEGNSNREFLQFQYSQLEEAALQDGEQEELEQEADMLGHAEEIKGALYAAATLLGEEGGNVIGSLRQTVQALSGIARVYAPADALCERTESTRIELEDIVAELEQSLERVEYDPERQRFVDDRLSLLFNLQKKHGVDSVAGLIEVKQQIEAELNGIENSDEAIAEQEKTVKELRLQLDALGSELTSRRKAAAATTEDALKETLAFLGMPHVQLHFEFSPRTEPDTSGFDNVAFLFSANLKVPEQDVSQIASGGETARLMLALKAHISRSRHLPTIIFDEIDTGVSGTIAEKMAQVMQRMAETCQVLCITHLPQIAALGTHHYRVFKADTEQGTTSHLQRLDNEERIKEIANMLSGEEMTEAAISNARSLLHMDGTY